EIEQGSNRVLQYLTGYTDYVGVSLQTRQLDPNMRFHINNSFQFARTEQLIGGIPHQVLRPTRLNNVLVNYGYTAAQMQSSTLARPEDVTNYIGTSTLREQLMGQTPIAYEGSTLTKRAMLSNVRNGN